MHWGAFCGIIWVTGDVSGNKWTQIITWETS